MSSPTSPSHLTDCVERILRAASPCTHEYRTTDPLLDRTEGYTFNASSTKGLGYDESAAALVQVLMSLVKRVEDGQAPQEEFTIDIDIGTLLPFPTRHKPPGVPIILPRSPAKIASSFTRGKQKISVDTTAVATWVRNQAAQYAHDLALLNARGGAHIRLMRISKAQKDKRKSIHLDSQIFALASAPRYTAVSHTWSAEPSSKQVRFLGALQGLKSISHNLRRAIRALHNWQPDGWFWIDALCIDQSSLAEKNDQVPRMRSIYAAADAVFVWLGSEVACDQADLDMYERCGNDRKDVEALQAFGKDTNERWTNVLRKGIKRGKILRILKTAQLHQPWWTRIWIIQEMAVATRLVVCIGPQAWHWEEFIWTAVATLSRFSEKAGFEVGRQTERRFLNLSRIREANCSSSASNDIWELLKIGRESGATDLRDHVYGLLGVMKQEDRKAICVDYGRSIAEVYAELTLHLIKKAGSLDFLVNEWTHNR